MRSSNTIYLGVHREAGEKETSLFAVDTSFIEELEKTIDKPLVTKQPDGQGLFDEFADGRIHLTPLNRVRIVKNKENTWRITDAKNKVYEIRKVPVEGGDRLNVYDEEYDHRLFQLGNADFYSINDRFISFYTVYETTPETRVYQSSDAVDKSYGYRFSKDKDDDNHEGPGLGQFSGYIPNKVSQWLEKHPGSIRKPIPVTTNQVVYVHNSEIHAYTLGKSVAFAVADTYFPAGTEFTLVLRQDAKGGHGFKFLQPNVSPGAAVVKTAWRNEGNEAHAISILTLIYDGSCWIQKHYQPWYTPTTP